MRTSAFLFPAILTFCSYNTQAQNAKVDTVRDFKVDVNVPKRFYVGNGLDFIMLSTSINKTPSASTYLTVPRFNAIINIGFTFNYDLGTKFGLFSGLGLRNMGFIEKNGDSTIKRRVWSLGIPFGIKIGDLRNRNYAFFGGGIDLPFHYKEKGFVKRSDKDVYTDWLSDRTPRVLPFVFVGHSWDPGITLKIQYYPTNFLNESYAQSSGGMEIKPYDGYKVNLLLLSLGVDIHYNQYRIQQKEYQEIKKAKEQNKLL